MGGIIWVALIWQVHISITKQCQCLLCTTLLFLIHTTLLVRMYGITNRVRTLRAEVNFLIDRRKPVERKFEVWRKPIFVDGDSTAMTPAFTSHVPVFSKVSVYVPLLCRRPRRPMPSRGVVMAPVMLEAPNFDATDIGCASLVAGTMVGAGVLALPAVSAPSGFIPATSVSVLQAFVRRLGTFLLATTRQSVTGCSPR